MHTTDQLNTALAGRYEIERRIGAGGMATVYLARDVKHHRKVALKVLSPELGAVLGPERFLAEIEVTANLHHPHLLPLFDSGEAGGLLFYVMPYIEGETLRARIERERQLTVEDAVRITCAIASALDYAHRHGVVHRDLKPENVLLHDNQPLVMDFGIALAVSNAGGARITQTGLSLGTPQYMSPEQATGDRQIDGRSDIYSLGAVAYELLTGEPPHTGATVQAIIARVITDRTRSMRASRETIPEHVDAAVLRALAKLPADRFSTATEFGEAMMGQRPVTMPAGVQHPGQLGAGAFLPSGSVRRRVPWREMIAWGVALASLGALAWQWTRPKPLTPFGQFRFELPDSIAIPSGAGTKVDITRDGSLVVFVGDHDEVAFVGGSGRRLYLRRADDPLAVPIAGTDTAFNPVFSPRGDWIAFGTGTGATLRKISIQGGRAQRLADSMSGRPSWGDDDRIVFVRRTTQVMVINSDGSEPRVLAKVDSSRRILRFGWPDVLPGSKHALITYWTGATILDSARLGLMSLSDGSLVDLRMAGTNPHYVAPGYVLFGRPGGALFAAPFSLSSRTFTGSAAPLLDNLWQGTGGATEFAVANNGLLIHHGGAVGRVSRLLRVKPNGDATILLSRGDALSYPRVSPDGSRIAVSMGLGSVGSNPNAGIYDIWILDVGSSAFTKFTTEGLSHRPEWTSDGKRIFYVSRASLDSTKLKVAAADGSGSPATVAAGLGGRKALNEISSGPPGSYSVYRVGNTEGGSALYISAVNEPASMRPFVESTRSQLAPRVSPSGKMVAYSSDPSGRMEVYLRSLPGPGGVIPVSVNGGTEPVWSRDGKTLFYRTPAGQIMAATIDERTQRVLSRRVQMRDDYLSVPTHQNYDVFPNGDFLFIGGTPPDSRIAVTTDWKRLLTRRAGADRPF